MTAWNGEKHLLRQLDSIREQTFVPTEVLIFDDHSTDQTKSLVTAYISDHQLDHWSFAVNQQQLGWKRNFMQGIRQAQGDLIFLADQDDEWYPEKISDMVSAMLDRPEILLLACDYKVVYEPGAIKAKVYKKKAEESNNLVARYIWTRRFFMNPNPGCTYAIRRDFFQEVQSLWFDDAPHDEFLWLMAALKDGAYFYNKVLMDYIRYGGNASSITYKDIAMQQKNLAYISAMLDRLTVYAERHSDIDPARLRQLSDAKVWCRKRIRLMEKRNPFLWLSMMPWWGYYNSWMNCLSDLYLVLFGKFKRNSL